MAEAAAAATILQLIQFSGVVLTGCYAYISKAQSATAELQKVINDVSGLEGILRHLDRLISEGESERHAMLISLGRPSGPLKACEQALKELQKRLLALTQASSARRKLLWPLEEAKILEILRRLGEQKQTVLLALAGDHAMSDDANAKQAKEAVVRLRDMQTREERAKVVSWLSGADPSTNYNTARRKHEKDTGAWLLQSENFQSWSKSDGEVMWLFGIPGAGKTILSSTVIDHLVSRSEKKPGYCVAYFYFDFNDLGKQTSSGCLKSMVQQLCAQTDNVPESIMGLYGACKGKSPSMTELVGALRSLIDEASTTYLIIDALDECREEEGDRERQALLEALSEIQDSSSKHANVFVTSRPEADIRSAMTKIGASVLEAQGPGVADDIRSFVVSFLSNDTRMKKWPENVKTEVIEVLAEKANGMFRWVDCQLESLRNCLKPKLATIKQKLSDLPRTLDSTYERIFQNMDTEYEREIRIVLMLLAFSVRPMTIQEVAEATAVNLNTTIFDPEDRFPDPYDVLDLCSGLVSLVDLGSDSGSALRKERGYSFFRWPQEIKIIQFAHFSVKEFILSERGQMSILPTVRFDQPIAQRGITEMCLIYLLDFNGGKRADSLDHDAFPMLAYAALHWTSHMASVAGDGATTIQELLIRLFDPDNADALMNFLNIYDPASSWRPFDEGKTVGFGFNIKRSKQDFETPLYYACHYGLLNIVQWLAEEENTNQSAKNESLGPALGAAAAMGHFEIAQMLLNMGANPNSSYCGKYYRPLHAAATSGNFRIVGLLLEAGAEVTAQGGEHGTALHLAAKQGSPDVIETLVKAGHPTEIKVRQYGTPLFLAAHCGNDKAVAMLVQSGANANASPGGYFSPLVAAATDCSVDSVRLLLEAGIEINVPGGSETALHCAAERADLDIMRLLIQRGADVNGPGGTYGTPLKASIQSRQLPSFQLMLDSGADINSRGSRLMYPVDQAIFGGNMAAADILLELGANFGDEAVAQALDWHTKEYLVKKLLERGADPNVEHKEYGNVLQFAVRKSSQEAVCWLLDAGADVNAIEGEYGTALQAACDRGRIGTVRLLLERGAVVNAPACGVYGHALQAAAHGEDENILQLLLDHGAEVNAIGGKYATALQAASSRYGGNPLMARILLEHGANPNIVGGQEGTALRAALEEGNKDIVNLLLENGASLSLQVSKKDDIADYCESLLEIGVATGSPDIIQLLIEHGFDIGANEEACTLALSRAARFPEPALLKFLIDTGVDVKCLGGMALSTAIDHGQEANFELLLKHGADPNYVHPDTTQWGCATALQHSIDKKRWKMMHRLLDSGADVNLKSPGMYGTALQAAIEKGAKDVLVELLDRGADVNIEAGFYGTALSRAAWKGEEDLLLLLCDRGADINSRYGYYGNALQAAIQQRYYATANWLLDRGADPHQPGMYANALIGACGHGKPGQVDLIKRIVGMGCDLNVFDQARPEDEKGIGEVYLYNPLSKAAAAGNIEVAKLLLEFGADINLVGGTCGTALQSAASHQHTAMARFLLDQGADVNGTGGEHVTALQAAVAEYQDESIKLLLDSGADVNIEGGYYGSPLQAACRKGVFRHVKLLLEHGAKVNTHSGHFDCPLQAAAKEGSLEIVQLLLDHGADVNAQGGKYGSPLQAACCDSTMNRTSRDGTKVVELLLEKGADVNAEGGKYGTPLQAAAYHHRKFVEILLKQGADPNKQGGKFGSAINAAKEKGLYRAFKLLIAHGAVDRGVANT